MSCNEQLTTYTERISQLQTKFAGFGPPMESIDKFMREFNAQKQDCRQYEQDIKRMNDTIRKMNDGEIRNSSNEFKSIRACLMEMRDKLEQRKIAYMGYEDLLTKLIDVDSVRIDLFRFEEEAREQAHKIKQFSEQLHVSHNICFGGASGASEAMRDRQ